jgi:dihydroorotase
MKIILKNVTLQNGERSDIEIENGLVAAMGSSSSQGIDCSGLIALPGFVDMHTHLRQPGFEASETVLSGSRSAAAGGYTAICAMANTEPVADNANVVERVRELGLQAGYCEVQPIGAVTKGLLGLELAGIGSMANSLAKVKVFSDDGNCVHDPLLMQRALEYVKPFGGLIAQHSQDPRLTPGSQMNAGALATELGLSGWPSVAEESIIARDALLAEQTGSRLHVCHLTTAGAVDVVRWAKKRGINITAEVTPHHLILTEELVRGYDPIYKVNPPLRRTEDTLALKKALVDGTIDVLGTDHAPHSIEKKDCEWGNAAFGMIGLETAAGVLQQVLIEESGESWDRFANIISSKPAELAQLRNQGKIGVGRHANITLIDPSKKRQIGSTSQSKSVNNPFIGLELPGEIVHTIFAGKFTVRDKQIQEIK